VTQERKLIKAETKAKAALEAIKGQRTLNEIGSAYQVHPTQVVKWKKQLLDQAATLFADRRGRVEHSDQQEKDRLYQQIGQLTVELDWVKKKSGLGR
jgi:transposase-like protein